MKIAELARIHATLDPFLLAARIDRQANAARLALFVLSITLNLLTAIGHGRRVARNRPNPLFFVNIVSLFANVRV